jgi:hypothetical protein
VPRQPDVGAGDPLERLFAAIAPPARSMTDAVFRFTEREYVAALERLAKAVLDVVQVGHALEQHAELGYVQTLAIDTVGGPDEDQELVDALEHVRRMLLLHGITLPGVAGGPDAPTHTTPIDLPDDGPPGDPK